MLEGRGAKGERTALPVPSGRSKIIGSSKTASLYVCDSRLSFHLWLTEFSHLRAYRRSARRIAAVCAARSSPVVDCSDAPDIACSGVSAVGRRVLLP